MNPSLNAVIEIADIIDASTLTTINETLAKLRPYNFQLNALAIRWLCQKLGHVNVLSSDGFIEFSKSYRHQFTWSAE